MKFLIKQIQNQVVTVEILDKNKVMLTKEFEVNEDLDLDRLKRILKQEVTNLEVKTKKEDKLKANIDSFTNEIGNKLDL